MNRRLATLIRETTYIDARRDAAQARLAKSTKKIPFIDAERGV